MIYTKKNTAAIYALLCLCVMITAGCEAKESGLYQVTVQETADTEGSDTETDDMSVGDSHGEDADENVSSDVDAAEVDTAEDAKTGQVPAVIYVHICGAVANPGVYEFKEGDRIFSAIEAAGGFTEEACEDYVNLAEALSDGMKIVIPTCEQAEDMRSGSEDTAYGVSDAGQTAYDGNSVYTSDTGSSPSDGLVNINTAGVDELITLTGIGETRAKAIVDYRESAGSFAAKEDIKNVNGIGDAVYAGLEDEITTGNE